jgi:arginase
MAANPTVSIVGIPLDLGQSRRGVDMGPSAIRYAGIHERLRSLGYPTEDLGNLETRERATLPPEGGGFGFLPAVVEAAKRMYKTGQQAIADGRWPLFLGGDHSISAGTVGGISHKEPVGLLWIDAHGDFNTPETSPSGNIHGMPLAALCGRGAAELVNVGRKGPKVDPRDVVLIGTRDLDAPERDSLRDSGITIFTMSDIDDRGIADVARDALERLRHRKRLHVSLDLDVMDPREAPGVGTPVTGGITYREAHLLMEILAKDDRVGSADVVEVNPILDSRNQTAEMAVELVASLLGKAIL